VVGGSRQSNQIVKQEEELRLSATAAGGAAAAAVDKLAKSFPKESPQRENAQQANKPS